MTCADSGYQAITFDADTHIPHVTDDCTGEREKTKFIFFEIYENSLNNFQVATCALASVQLSIASR